MAVDQLLVTDAEPSADFEGPNEAGEFTPEEERLVGATPQPADTDALPAWRQPHAESDPPLDVAATCHVIAARAIPALFAPKTPTVPVATLGLLDTLLPLLAVPPEQRGSTASARRLGEYFEGFSRVLELQIRVDGASVVASLATESGVLDETPVLGPVALQVLALTARCAPYLCLGAR